MQHGYTINRADSRALYRNRVRYVENGERLPRIEIQSLVITQRSLAQTSPARRVDYHWGNKESFVAHARLC